MADFNKHDFIACKYSNEPYSDIMALWALRAIIHLKGHKTFVTKNGYSDDDVLNIIGLPALTDIDDIGRKHATNILKKRLQRLESKTLSLHNGTLTKNISWLGNKLSLSKEEELILLYSVLLTTTRDLKDAVNTIGHLGKHNFISCLSTVLGMTEINCKQAINSNSTLVSSGLIKINHDSDYFSDKLTPISKLPDVLLAEHTDKSNILNKFFTKSPDAKLSFDDFIHISSDHDLIKDYLLSASSKKTKGVNILIHGEPGIGKTEFVRMLIQSINLTLYEITMKDDDGDSVSGDSRFSVYQLSQKLLSQQDNCVILFDEIEDVFPEPPNSLFFSGSIKSNSAGNKAWVNNLLENNLTPTFWLSNAVHQMDDAYLRRFDYVMEFKQPTRTGRKKIIEKYLGNQPINKNWIDTIANNEHISPALIEKAAKIAAHISCNNKTDLEHTLEKVIDNMLNVLGHPNVEHTQNNTGIDYDISYINADANIKQLCNGLKQHGSGRLCLYGASGTGKTALGRHIAEYIDKPLIVKRGSDIMSMWVGESEKNIAKMFRQATDENAVLLLDEADSFIQARQSAKNSWEITQVNELLVQMENFNGIFIASTNLIEILDSASLRRFDFKIKFDYIKKDSAITLFNNIIQKENWDNTLSPSEAESKIRDIPNIALGDFHVALRKMSFCEKKTSSIFLKHLEGESKLKPDSQRHEIGFSANIH